MNYCVRSVSSSYVLFFVVLCISWTVSWLHVFWSALREDYIVCVFVCVCVCVRVCVCVCVYQVINQYFRMSRVGELCVTYRRVLDRTVKCGNSDNAIINCSYECIRCQ
jgi:hypothetical protein